MLATPPGFRPQHIEATIKAGKHLFAEKPVAVDGTGIRKVLAAYEEANKKGLSVVTGTQRRHQAGYVESLKRIHEGAIGDIVTARVYWNQGDIWAHKRQPGWSDTEYQVRNWYHFLWLCGDHITEQHVHNLDVACWAIGAHPVKAVGMGGRQVINEPERGQSYDHFAVDYEFPNGVHVLSMCRQIAGCASNVSETIVGTNGEWHSGGYRFNGRYKSRVRVPNEVNPYVQEHMDLLESISTRKPVNELKQVAESTLTAILGRTSAYTGKEVTWEQALNSKLDTFPKTLDIKGPMEEPPVPKPGVTELI
jgi:predicted dehydrogenase